MSLALVRAGVVEGVGIFPPSYSYILHIRTVIGKRSDLFFLVVRLIIQSVRIT